VLLAWVTVWPVRTYAICALVLAWPTDWPTSAAWFEMASEVCAWPSD
jgi:hypothetical protein